MKTLVMLTLPAHVVFEIRQLRLLPTDGGIEWLVLDAAYDLEEAFDLYSKMKASLVVKSKDLPVLKEVFSRIGGQVEVLAAEER